MAKKLDKNAKIYRGAYQYERNGNIYLEENFDVYKDKKAMNFNFVSQLISRVSTGELLTVDVDYTINKSYIPVRVSVQRTLGDERIEELYRFDNRKNILVYHFISKDGEEICKLQANPKFFIATPALCTSMLYIRSKKLDPNGKNYYNIFVSENQWTFAGPPQGKILALERVSSTPENITIAGNNLQGTHYKIFDTEDISETYLDNGRNEKRDIIHSFTSAHMTIPYLVKSDDGTKIQVKYLNDLSQRGTE